jgi:ferredoxin
LVLAAAVALAWPLQTDKWTAIFLPSISPYIALGAALVARSAGLLALLALPVFLLALVFPRWFCQHGCPTGWLQELLERLHPPTQPRWQRWPSIGKWIVFLTLGGAILGYPFFLWLDPLALFNGFLNAWRPPLAFTTLVSGLGLPALLLFDLLWPRLWCQRLCPLGATQELLSLPRHLACRSARCETIKEESAPAPGISATARRSFLIACAGAVGAFAARIARGQPSFLRPPGSIEEARFSGTCVRCGNCAQACPSRIIQPDLGQSGVAGFLTPTLRFDRAYCREDCHRCNQVCPSGAIARLELAEKQRCAIGLAQVNLDTCFLAYGRECTACIKGCPYEAVVLQTTAGGLSASPRIDLGKCTGCGACVTVCPVRPQRAIRVVARELNQWCQAAER